MSGSDSSSGNSGNRRTSISRRGYLGGIVGGGISGIGLSEFAIIKGGGSVSIPIIKFIDGSIKSKDVPQEWNDQRVHANKMNERAKEEFYEISGVKEIGVGRDKNRTYGGRNGFQLDVGVLAREYEGGVPDSLEGVPVEVEEVKPPEFASCGVTETFDTNIPGGVSLTKDNTGCPGYATNCCRVTDGSDQWMLTATHIWGGSRDPCPSDASVGDPAYHDKDHYGDLVALNSWNKTEDWTKLEARNGHSFNLKIWDPTASSLVDVAAWYTKAGIQDLIESQDTVRSVGTTTGRTGGPVIDVGKSVNGWDCVDFGEEGVECSITIGKGDSGGPVFNYGDQGNAVMITFNSMLSGQDSGYTISCHPFGSSCSKDKRVEDELSGTGFYHLDNAHGITPG